MSEALPPAEFAQALKRRRAANRRRKLLLLGSVGGGILVVGLLAYLLLASPVFNARQVNVTGVSRLSADEVSQAAAVQLGVPLLRQDTAAIEARVETLPAVERARVALAWPNTVEIQVTERTAAFQLASPAGYQLIDASAVSFFVSPEPVAGVPLAEVTGADERLLTDVATVADALPDQVREQLVSIRATSVDAISLQLSEEREVVWGSAEQSELKAQVVLALLSVEASVYDVSAPQNPTTRE